MEKLQMPNSEFLQNIEEQMASLENLPKIKEKSEQIMSDLEREMDPQFFAVLRQIEVLATTGQITKKQADKARRKLEQVRLEFEGKTLDDRFLEWAIDRKSTKFVVEKENYKLKSTVKNELGFVFKSVTPLPDGGYLAFGDKHIYKCKGKLKEEIRDLDVFDPNLYQISSEVIFAVDNMGMTKIDNDEDSLDDQVWSFAEIAQVENFYISSTHLKNANEMILGTGDGSLYIVDLADSSKSPEPIFKSEGTGKLNPISAIDCLENTIFVGEGNSVYVGQGQEVKTIKAYRQGEYGFEAEDIFGLNEGITAIKAVSKDELIVGTRKGSIIRIYKNDHAWNSQIIGVGLRAYDLQVLPDGRVISAHASEGGSPGKVIAWKYNGNNWEDKTLIELNATVEKLKVFENGQIFVFLSSGRGEIYDGEVTDV